MESPLALVASITTKSARSLRDGEAPVSPDPDILDGVEYGPERSEAGVLKLVTSMSVDINAIRGGAFIEHLDDFDADRRDAERRQRPKARRPSAARQSLSGNAGLLSGAFERTPESTPIRVGASPEVRAKRARSPAAAKKVTGGKRAPSAREESPAREKKTNARRQRAEKTAAASSAAKPPASARATPEQTKKRSAASGLRSGRNPLRSMPHTPVDEGEVRSSRSSTPKKVAEVRSKRETSSLADQPIPRRRKSVVKDEENAGRQERTTERAGRAPMKREKGQLPGEGSPNKKRRASSSQEVEPSSRRSALREVKSEAALKNGAIGTPQKETRSESRLHASPHGAAESEVRSLAPSGFRSARPGEKAAPASGSASTATQREADPVFRKRGWTLTMFFERFKKAKDEWERLWGAPVRDKDAFERSSRDLVLLCFDLLLAREQEMRSKASELRRSKKKREELKKMIRNNYLYLSHKLIPTVLERLKEIGRSRDTLFYRMTTRKVKLRLFALSRLYEDEEEKRVNDITKMIDELAEANKGKGGKVELEMRYSELAQMRSFMTEYCNLLRICDGVVADDCGPQEPGAECYLQ